jgi:hypothetical protein
MHTFTVQVPNTSKQILSLTLLLGIILVMGTWVVLYWAEALFTESHLVGYYCCVSEQDLPAVGTLERTLGDFFRTFPGQYLPSFFFVGVNASIFAKGRLKMRGKVWFPLLFALFNALYLVLSTWLAGVSWSISDRVVGPLTSVYKGYHRTWYGIVLHLALWGVFFLALTRVSQVRIKRPGHQNT